VRVDTHGFDAKDCNRYVKMHPHRLPELASYGLTIYIDGSIEVVGALGELVERCASAHPDVHLYDHPFRDCAYEEAIVCARMGHVPLTVVVAQMRRYRAAGYPAHAGLRECNVIVRRHSAALGRVMEAWWDEYRCGAKRDQLSLGFVARQAGLAIGSLGESDPRHAQRLFLLHAHAPAERGWRVVLRARWNRLLLALLPRALLIVRDAVR
jgi:hypothetical protein